MINRPEYLNELISYKEKQIIKVITGVRRCGKSTLFKLYQDHLISTGVQKNQIISINLEDLDFEELLEYKKLHTYIKNRLCKNKFTYIFIDEIQNCVGFEKVVDSLFIKDNVDIYITGSNAYMLSGELSTLLSGRYVSVDMLPLSFKEYCCANAEKELNSRQLFTEYLNFGSFPYIADIAKDEPIIKTYVDGIYNTILIKDVAKREGITDVTLLESIVKVVASSIGSPISTKKICDTINSAGRKTSINSIDSYLKALCDAYIFYKVDRFDIKGRQYLKTLGKYYIVDTGLRNMLMSSGASDIGHLIENVTYLELLRRGYKVNIGKIAEKEVDFVAKNEEGLMYIQVSASVLDEKTLTRELASLENTNDHYPKILLTLDEVAKGANFNGIKHINLIDWLIGK